jgi:hypothetical protein
VRKWAAYCHSIVAWSRVPLNENRLLMSKKQIYCPTVEGDVAWFLIPNQIPYTLIGSWKMKFYLAFYR